MKSVGETMAIGRTFKEAFQKGLRSLEVGRGGFGADGKDLAAPALDRAVVEHRLRVPNSQRIFYLKAALEASWPLPEIYELTGIDPWFLENLRQITEYERELAGLVA